MAGEWETVELGEVAAVRSGYAFKSSEWREAGVPVVKIANVKGGRLEMSGCSFVSESTAAESGEFQLSTGDILIAMTGYIGEVARVRRLDLPCVLNQRVGKFSVRDEERLDADFLYTFLSWAETRQTIEGLGYGSAQANVSPSLIHKVEIPLPPLAEQKAIAAVLGALDDKIELNRRMNAMLEATARALFQSWFVDFDPVRAKLDGRQPVGLDLGTAALFPDSFKDSEVGHIPKGWHLGRLSDLCNLKRGHDLPSSSRTAGPIPVISSSGISGSHSETNIRGPGVVTGRYGTIGKVFYVETDYWPLNTTLYVDDFKVNPPRFIFHVLGEVRFQDYTDKAAVPGVNRNHLHEEPVVLPPILLRQAFENTVSPLWGLHTANETESHALATLRDTLLPKLLSGELSVADVALAGSPATD